MNHQKIKNRVNYLNKEYSPTHLNSDEWVSPVFKQEINKNYRENEKIKIVDDLLYQLPDCTPTLLKEQVYYIIQHYRLKEMCSTCKTEVILACIIIFIWKGYNKRLIINKNKLWETYDLNWEINARIIKQENNHPQSPIKRL